MSYNPPISSLPTYIKPNNQYYGFSVVYNLPSTNIASSSVVDPLLPILSIQDTVVTSGQKGTILFNLNNVPATKVVKITMTVSFNETKITNPIFTVGKGASSKKLLVDKLGNGNYVITINTGTDIISDGNVLNIDFQSADNIGDTATTISSTGITYIPTTGSYLLGIDTGAKISFTTQPVDTSSANVPAYISKPILLDLSSNISIIDITGINDYSTVLNGIQTFFKVINCQKIQNAVAGDSIVLTNNNKVITSGTIVTTAEGTLQTNIGSTSNLYTIKNTDSIKLFLVKKDSISVPYSINTLIPRAVKPVIVTYSNLDKVPVSSDNDLNLGYIGVQCTIKYTELPNYLVGKVVSLKVNSLIVKSAVVSQDDTVIFGTNLLPVTILLTDILSLVGPDQNNLNSQITLQANQLIAQSPGNIKIDFIDIEDNATISSANDFLPTQTGIQTYIKYSNLQTLNMGIQQGSSLFLFGNDKAFSYSTAVQENAAINTYFGDSSHFYTLEKTNILKLVQCNNPYKIYTLNYVEPLPVVMDLLQPSNNLPITKLNDFDLKSADIQTYVLMNNLQATTNYSDGDFAVLKINSINAKVGVVYTTQNNTLSVKFGSAQDLFTLKPGDSLKLADTGIVPIKPVTIVNASASELIIDLSSKTPVTLSTSNDFSGDPNIQTYISFNKLESKLPTVTVNDTVTLKINDVIYQTVQVEKNDLGNYILNYGSLNSLISLNIGDSLKLVSSANVVIFSNIVRAATPSPLYVNMLEGSGNVTALSIDNDFDKTASGIQTIVVYYNLDLVTFPVGSIVTLILNNEQVSTATIIQGATNVMASFGSASNLIVVGVGDILNILPFKPINAIPDDIFDVVFDPDGSYTINWVAVEHPLSSTSSVSYMVQESNDISFAQYTTIYQGTNLSTVIRNRPNGTYFYRILATSGNVTSPPSNIGMVTVGPIQQRKINAGGGQGISEGGGNFSPAGDGSANLGQDFNEVIELQINPTKLGISEIVPVNVSDPLLAKNGPLRDYISSKPDFNFQKLLQYINPDLV